MRHQANGQGGNDNALRFISNPDEGRSPVRVPGGHGVLLKDKGRVRPALEQARNAARDGKPALVNAWLDRSDFRAGSLSM